MPKLDLTGLPPVEYTTKTINVEQAGKAFSFTFAFPAFWSSFDQAALDERSLDLAEKYIGNLAIPILCSGSRIPISKTLCDIVACLSVAEEATGSLDMTPAEDWFMFSRLAHNAWQKLIEEFFSVRKELYPKRASREEPHHSTGVPEKNA